MCVVPSGTICRARATALALVVAGLPRSASAAEEAPTLHVSGEAPSRSASETTRERPTISAAPHRTAADLLLIVPGVFITQHSGQGKAYQIFYRGFDSVHGQDIELKVGGVPVNEVSNIHGQGYADLHFVMPEVVHRIHAAPGSYLPSQGDFAVAGSISLSLGLDEPGVTAKASMGSFGEHRYFVAYHPEGSAPTTFGAFEAQSTDGFGPSRAARRTSAIAQHVFDIGHGLELRALATTYAARFDSAGVLLRSDAERDRFATYDPRQGGYSSRSQLVLDLTHAHSESDARWSLMPYLAFRSLKLRQNFTGFLEHPTDGDSTQQINEATTLGGIASYRKPLHAFSVSDAVEVGLSLRNDWIEQSQRAMGAIDDRVLATSVDARIRATNAAGWIDLVLKPVRRLTLRGGIRVDGLAYASQDNAPSTKSVRTGEIAPTGQARSAAGQHVGPKLTIDVRAIGALHIVGSYGEGFRSPQARSLGEGERTPFTTVRSTELGVRYNESSRVQALASVFATWLSDDLAFDPTTARNERVPSTFRRGFLVDLVLSPSAWFVASSSATYTRATFTGSDAQYGVGDVLPYVPQLVVRQDVAFTPVLGRIGRRLVRGRLGTGMTGLLGRPLPYGAYGDDIFLVDVAASVRVGEVELGVDVFNLLGARWFDGMFVYASNWSRGAAPPLVPREHVTAGAPRSVLATLSVYL